MPDAAARATGHTIIVTALSAFTAPDRPVADRLRRAPSFASLPTARAECLSVLRQGVMYDLSADVVLVSPGDPPALIVVIEGGLHDDENAQSWPAGSCVGVRELTDNLPFASALATVSPTSIYRLEVDLFESFRRRCPAIAQCLSAELSSHASLVAGPVVGRQVSHIA